MPFEFQPALQGKLIHLQPLAPGDFDALYAVATDPLIWEQHPVRDRYQSEIFEQFFHEALASGGALLASEASTAHAIGSSRFHGFDAERSEIEIGWTFLARSYWGGQCNGEMKRLMLRHAFQFVDNVIFVIGVHNLRSQLAVQKIGAVPVGERKDDTGRDSYVFRIIATDHAAS